MHPGKASGLTPPPTAGAAAELRTPLNAVVAFNTLALERGRLDATDTEFISESLVGAEALLGIVSDILVRDPGA